MATEEQTRAAAEALAGLFSSPGDENPDAWTQIARHVLEAAERAELKAVDLTELRAEAEARIRYHESIPQWPEGYQAAAGDDEAAKEADVRTAVEQALQSGATIPHDRFWDEVYKRTGAAP